MKNNQGFAMGRGGYALAVLSRRCRGHVVPVDLLRVVASVANRAGVRRRVSAAFAGYLVTDAGPGVVPMFSARRAAHGVRIDESALTGCWEMLRSAGGGPLDAPEFIAAGGCMNGAPFIADGESAALLSVRWSESLRGVDWPVRCDAVPIWRDGDGRVVVLGAVFTGRAMAGDDEVLREEFAGALSGAALDAPCLLLSGSCEEYEGHKRGVHVGHFWRDGVFR